MEAHKPSSRVSGFYKKLLRERLRHLLDTGLLSDESKAHWLGGGGLDTHTADLMSENVFAVHGLPLSVALNFRVNGEDVLVPMSVEEPSVVAAASNAARLVRLRGGFTGEATAPVMTTQVQLSAVPNASQAADRLAEHREAIIALANAAVPSLVRRGGGCRDLETRILDANEGFVVVHLYVDVRNAMGANLVDTVAEAVAPTIHGILGGRVGLRILSNLPTRRTIRVCAQVNADAIGGTRVADAIVDASRFAELDPYRAVTHNKGIMNGVDAVALALGQDWRSIEAGAHGWAAVQGSYQPLAVWRRIEDGIEGILRMPLAVGTVGGSTKVHPGVQAAFELLGTDDAQRLAVVMGAAGLASNLAALRALSDEGIQEGHMRLHRRKAEQEQQHAFRSEG